MIDKVYDIDFKRLVRWKVPERHRVPNLLAFVYALIQPLISAHLSFLLFRKSRLYQLEITPQVCYLERMLNDRFDVDDRRIYIADAIDRPPVYLYQDDEEKPVYLGSRPLYRDTEFGLNLDDFVVHVHNMIIFDFNEMRQLVNIYKLAGTRFSIQIY